MKWGKAFIYWGYKGIKDDVPFLPEVFRSSMRYPSNNLSQMRWGL